MLPSALPTGWPTWTRDNWRTLVRKDPLNLFFTGGCGGLSAAFDELTQVGFKPAKTGASQWFALDLPFGAPEQHVNDESVDDSGRLLRWERTHARLYHSGTPDPSWGPVTAAPIHHDLPKPSKWLWLCGEVATSFNGPRDAVARRIAALGHESTRIRTRERRSVRQCDGSRVAPDGWIVLVA